jgi:metallo-beta-lactamase family protein
MAKITFLGAAGTVTGSKYLIEAGGKRLLVDCGLFQGSHDLTDRNWQTLPIEPASIDWVVLTHAHIDHSGYIPRLVKAGYRGPFYCNPSTHELCTILLLDSAHLQEEEAQFAQKKGYSQHKPALPLYTVAEAQTALNQFREIPRADSFAISPEFSVRPHDAGHILGSTWLELTITENGKQTLVVFSGDIGRYDQVILKDPEPPSRADYLLCESTYGDRDHPAGSTEAALGEVVNRVVKRGGSIVVPSFAVGRIQTLMYFLKELQDQNKIPKLPVYVDSPMAISVTDLYERHHEDHDVDFSREEAAHRDPLNVANVHMTRSVEDSKKINDVVTPCIILSASGMATGGRVLHHLAKRLPDSRNAVLIVGYQAVGTLGRQIEDGSKLVKIFGEMVPVRAEVVDLPQLSAHAGRSELLRWLSGIKVAPKMTFLVHGEPVALESFRGAVDSTYHWPVTVAGYQQTFEFNL